ncbi:MAG: DEAD/DEAH box helicase [Promethearchaeota archaeon]|nr:MAG: DEAD/DEAH box helicase [Candidatus Lokiarchaeota archaeon]
MNSPSNKILNKELQLTFIPSKYWNETSSEFSLIDTKKKIPSDSDFFLIWTAANNSPEYLERQMKKKLVKIPVDKLLSCHLNLALLNQLQNGINNFVLQKVYGKILPLLPASRFLNNLEIFEPSQEENNSPDISGSIKTWALLTKFIFELLNRGNFVPFLKSVTKKKYNGQWRLLLKTKYDNIRFTTILRNSPWTAYNLPYSIKLENNSSNDFEGALIKNLWHPSYLYSLYIDKVGDSLIRSILKKQKFRTFDQYYNSEIQKDKRREHDLSWDYKFLKSLLSKDPSFTFTQFHETIVPKLIRNWINIESISSLKQGIELAIKLNYPQNGEDQWPLNLFLSVQNGQNLILLSKLWKGEESINSEILTRFQNQENFTEILFQGLGKMIKIYPPLKKALNGPFPKKLMLNSSEVMEFFSYAKDLLIQSGFNVILPDAFQIGGKQRLSARMVIYSEKTEFLSTIKSSRPSLFQLSDMLNYRWEGELGNEYVNSENLKDIIAKKQPLVNIKDEWILIDQQDIETISNIFDSTKEAGKYSGVKGKINYVDALKLGLSERVSFREEKSNYRVIVEGSFNQIIDRIKKFESFKEIATPSQFNGKLRGYQREGLTWLANICELGFGVCLADDMGLGKTIEVISLLLHFKETHEESMGAVLIICPTSVIYNWKKELNRFAPTLDITFHHGIDRSETVSALSKYLKPHQIILTTYGTLRNDIELLKTAPFSGVIVDESQNMKNPKAQQTQAIYQLQSQYRICLSGTPIENRLMELWSLFKFLNPGLLGNQKEFRDNFVIPIERFHDKEAADRLKRIIAPFILRRVKTDKSIIKDLPSKREMKIYIDLSDDQKALYKNVVSDTLQEMERSKSQKSMIILGLLTKLKQICNHPYQYQHKSVSERILDDKFKEFVSMSPKLERLIDMLDEVLVKNEKAIIFTQFTQMGDILRDVLEYRYDFPILYFHGGIRAEKRRDIISEFQDTKVNSPPILILSLKAGGTGINLTEATTVFHFDRWWNPAVEKQATDRAYRIGQTENVNVYKFITLNTIEEKIDKLIEEKKELADMIITSGESWISELSEDKLKELISMN